MCQSDNFGKKVDKWYEIVRIEVNALENRSYCEMRLNIVCDVEDSSLWMQESAVGVVGVTRSVGSRLTCGFTKNEETCVNHYKQLWDEKKMHRMDYCSEGK